MLEANWLDEVLESINEERSIPCHSVSPQKKQISDKITEPETLMDKGSSNFVTSITRVTPKNDRFVKKSADIEEPQRKQRREKVLAILAKNTDTQRAILTDTNADHDNVILTIAIRDQCTYEMQIPKNKYDGFAILEMIHKELIQ